MIGATELADAAAQLETQTATDHATTQPWDQTTTRTLFDHWTATRAAIELELAQTK